MAPERGPLVVATHNAGKFREFAELLRPFGWEPRQAGDFGLAVPLETGATFLENATLKARAAAETTGLPALADDSGLCVEALGGMPGVHSADWAETPEGRDDGLAMQRLRAELARAGAAAPWPAAFRCVLVLARRGGALCAAEGVLDGEIVWPPRGSAGHGYDPVFLPAKSSRTLAELTLAEKNAISHRRRALDALAAACFT